MKYLFLLFSFFLSNFIWAQDPIQVIVTGECEIGTGQYTFSQVLNNKNSYCRTIEVEGETIQTCFSYNGNFWVWHVYDDITDDGFYNLNVPDGILPPNTGWIPQTEYGCNNGTLTIIGGANLSIDFFKTHKILIYPNPVTDFLYIDGVINEYFELIDSSGRILYQDNIKESIDVSMLENGVYYFKINSTTLQFIKQ